MSDRGVATQDERNGKGKAWPLKELEAKKEEKAQVRDTHTHAHTAQGMPPTLTTPIRRS